MILIQTAVPLACAFGLLFAVWFLFDLRLRSPGSDELQTAVAASRREGTRLFARFVPFAGIGIIVVVPAVAALVGWAHESTEDAAYVAAAAALGVLLALVVWMASPAVAGLATGRTAAALENETGVSPAFAALWGGASIALFGGVVALGAPVALFGAYTAGVDVSIPLVPQLVAGFVAGAAAVAGATRLVAAGYAHATGEEEASPRSGAFLGVSGSALGLISLLSLAVVASSAPAGALWMTTGEAAWMLLPTAVLAFGLFASALGTMTLALWTRLFSPVGATRLGYWTVAVLSGTAAIAAPFAMPEGSIFFGLAGLVGVAGALLVVSIGPGSQDGAPAAGWPGVVIVAVLAGAAALGREAEIDGIARELAALLGVGLAVAGFLMSAAYVTAVRAAAAAVEDAVAMAKSETPAALDSFQHWAKARAASYNVAAMLLVAVLAGLAMLTAARWETAAAALDDPEGYLDVAVELHLAPDSSEVRSQQSIRIADFAEDVNDLRVALSDEEAAFLFAGLDRDVRPMARRKLADDELSDSEAAAIGGGPIPLPRLLPLDVTALPTLSGLVGGLAAMALAVALLGRARRATPDGPRFNVVPVLLALLLLLAVPALAVAYRFLEGGASGWQAGVGTVVGLALAAALLSSAGSKAKPGAPGGAGSAALMVIAILVAVAPILVA